MTDREIELNLLLAQAQRVGRLHEHSVHRQIEDGRNVKTTKLAWARYYEALQKQSLMKQKFLADLKD